MLLLSSYFSQDNHSPCFLSVLKDEKWGNSIGLPGTRNVIQKWSLTHLGGIDLTSLGPPAKRTPVTRTSPSITSQNIDNKIDSIKETIDSINEDISSSIIKSTLSDKQSDIKVLKTDEKYIEVIEKIEEVSNGLEINENQS